jgi:hypothetical protein
MKPMDVRALILVNSSDDDAEERLPFASPPLPLLDVAGHSPLVRMARRLEHCGISPVVAVVEERQPAFARAAMLPPGIDCRAAVPERFWRAAENAFSDMATSGADLVLVIRMGAYAEIDFERFLHFHLEQHSRVSRIIQEAETLDILCINGSRRNDAASLFRSRLAHCRSGCEYFVHHGYINRLSDARDLRQFAIDILTLKTETATGGTEVRPGIWAASGACIEKGSRILAPAFIGASALIRNAAVITRCTSVENHAQIDCGTVVENCSVLAYTSVGACLDLSHSVAGLGQIVHLRRGVVTEVADEKLLGQVPRSVGERLAGAAVQLPRKIWRGLFGGMDQQEPAMEPDLSSGSSELLQGACGSETSRELAPNLVIARRYGDQ